VNGSAAISLGMTSSARSDVINRYPSSQCSLSVAARPGQRLSFTVFTLGRVGEREVDVDDGWGSAERGRAVCDARRHLYIVDVGRTVSSSLCHLPRFNSRQRVVYTSTQWRVAIYWTWTGAGQSTTESDTSRSFNGYILKVEG